MNKTLLSTLLLAAPMAIAAEAVPTLKVEESCRAAATISDGRLTSEERCMSQENSARAAGLRRQSRCTHARCRRRYAVAHSAPRRGRRGTMRSRYPASVDAGVNTASRSVGRATSRVAPASRNSASSPNPHSTPTDAMP